MPTSTFDSSDVRPCHAAFAGVIVAPQGLGMRLNPGYPINRIGIDLAQAESEWGVKLPREIIRFHSPVHWGGGKG